MLLPVAVEAQSVLSFPRAIAPAEFSTTGFAVVNAGPTIASVLFTFYGADGTALKTTALPVPARGQLSKLASELYPGATAPAWVRATSDTSGLQGFWIGGDFANFADGAEAATMSSDLVIPLIAPQSEISVANTGGADVTVLLHLLGPDGFDVATPFPQRISANGFFKASVLPLFPPLGDLSQVTHMRIECKCANATPFAATLVARDFIVGPSWAVVNGVPSSATATTLNFPHIVDGPQTGANWKSVIGITNLSPASPNDVNITFMSQNGTPVATIQQTLLPGGGLRAGVRDLFALPPGFQDGWLQVSSAGGKPVTGYVTYAETNNGGVAVVLPQTESQTNLLFPHIADLPPFLTGLAMLNTNATPANIQLYALRPDGSLIGTAAFALPAGAKIARLLSEWVPQTQTRTSDGGFVFVRSDSPLLGIELFFSRNLSFLANVSAASGKNYIPPQ
jgi:hypothetical protein